MSNSRCSNNLRFRMFETQFTERLQFQRYFTVIDSSYPNLGFLSIEEVLLWASRIVWPYETHWMCTLNGLIMNVFMVFELICLSSSKILLKCLVTRFLSKILPNPKLLFPDSQVLICQMMRWCVDCFDVGMLQMVPIFLSDRRYARNP